VFEQKKVVCVETLLEWIMQEAEFQTVVAETLCGLIGKIAHTPSSSGQVIQESLQAQIAHFVREIIQCGAT